jgi:hypothetical protein
MFLATKKKDGCGGQSLIELLMGIGLGVIFITAATAAIVPSLRSNTQAQKIQTSAALGNELVGNLKIWSDANWNSLLALSTGTAYYYYLNTSSSPFTVASGTVETLVVGTSTYTRSFSLSDVYRDSSGNIVTSGGAYDPSSKFATITYGWSNGSTNSMTTLLTRTRNNVFSQSDWSGGPGQDGPVSFPNDQFATSSNIKYTNAGVISLPLPGY